MVEATFIASGKTSLEALEMAASVASEEGKDYIVKDGDVLNVRFNT